MVSLSHLTAYLRDYLRLDEIPDFSASWNGLQIENEGEVTRIAAAVDSHLPVVRKAVEENADLLLVHHGLFWNGIQPFQGAMREKLKLALDHNLSLYSAHHPLDVHPVVGNNALLAKSLGLSGGTGFFPYKGTPIGLQFEGSWAREEFTRSLTELFGTAPILAPGGPETIQRLGICTGGAGGEIQSVRQEGVDTFLTGEGPHWSFPLAEELGINLYYAGHYATETFGVKALAQHLAEEFDLSWFFVDHPTGL
ncbi:MAG: Nif3-like dinuclear metal center hexameric protein [Verrucomicrobiota bacterium]